ncbi:Tuberous sclerosis 2-like protein [Toensbergia leucococca]|nr:Tuberous sclerosis 2-like protein [Toensbergia leucococca]
MIQRLLRVGLGATPGPVLNNLSAEVLPKSMNPASDDSPETPGTNVSSPTLTDRVKDLTAGLASTSPLPRTRSSGKITDPTSPSTNKYNRRSLPEKSFRENCLRDFNAGRKLSDRIKSIEAACDEIEIYSVDTLMAIWAAAEDLTTATDSPEARKAWYALLVAAVSHSGLGPEERWKFFGLIATFFNAVDFNVQTLALRKLTHNGRDLDPFEGALILFLNRLLHDRYEDALVARERARRQRSRRSVTEDKALVNVLFFVADVITNSPEAFDRDQLDILVGQVFTISRKTVAQDDLRGTASIVGAITALSKMPSTELEECIEVLCAISSTGGHVVEVTWRSLQDLLVSSDGQRSLEILLNLLSEAPRMRPPKIKPSALRGAIIMMKRLVTQNGAGNLPIIPFPLIADALWQASSFNSRLEVDCMNAISYLLDEDDVASRFLQEKWETLFENLRDRIESQPDNGHVGDGPSDIQSVSSGSIRSNLSASSPLYRSLPILRACELASNSEIVWEWQNLAFILNHLWHRMATDQRALVSDFYLHIHQHIGASCLELVVDHFETERYVFPSDQNWVPHLKMLIDILVLDQAKATTTRCRVMQTVKDVYLSILNPNDKAIFQDEIIMPLLEGIEVEKPDLPVANALAELMTRYALDAEIDIFDKILTKLSNMTYLGEAAASHSSVRISRGLTHDSTIKSLIILFLECLTRSPVKANKVFNTLLATASHRGIPRNTRLIAIMFLVRLRCDSDHAIIVVDLPDTQGLADVLRRTESSAPPQTFEQSVFGLTPLSEDSPPARTGRTSAIANPAVGSSRSTTRSASGKDWSAIPTRPLWMYPDSSWLPEDLPTEASRLVYADVNGPEDSSALKLSSWLKIMSNILQEGDDWEIYSYILVHLPSQLTNPSLFAGAVPIIKGLRRVVASQLHNGSFYEPPSSSGLKKGDVALCLFHSLTVLLGYREYFARGELDDITNTFLVGIGSWDRAAKCCIHALELCCHEAPSSVDRVLSAVIQKMSQIITVAHLAKDTLEFLGGLARLPHVWRNLREDEHRIIFGICIRFLHHSREKRENASRMSYTSLRQSGNSGEYGRAIESVHAADAEKGLPLYVYALAYHVMTIWFLSLKIHNRSRHVGWIAKNLAWKDESGKEILEEQSQVTLDMMHRTAYLDLGETISFPKLGAWETIFGTSDGEIKTKTWLVGMSIVTVETAVTTGLTRLTKRQASGTTHATYQQQTAPLPPHHVLMPYESESRSKILPSHVFLQLTSTIAPTPIPMQPIVLPHNDIVFRAIDSFDRNSTVDGHKVGVIYIGNSQKSEASVLANTSGSRAYDEFLSGLGTKVKLRAADFNTQGLDDKSNCDGTHTYAWRDRITEIIFHITTMMPTNIKNDPQYINKKKHIGNDYVKIIFNESGLPFDFDMFPSQFNYVNIVITPESSLVPRADDKFADQASATSKTPMKYQEEQQRFKVQTLCFPSFPPISPAAVPKLICASALSGFVRQLALNASVFSLTWSSRDGGEHVSSWRNRLREITKLRKRYANTGSSANTAYPGVGTAYGGFARKYDDGDEWRGNLTIGGMAEENLMQLSLDFSRWAE